MTDRTLRTDDPPRTVHTYQPSKNNPQTKLNSRYSPLILPALSTPILTGVVIHPSWTHISHVFSDETFARFFPLGVGREENFQPLISKIFILPYTALSMCEARRKGPSVAEGRHASFLPPSHSTGSRVFSISRTFTVVDVCGVWVFCLSFPRFLLSSAELLLMPIFHSEMRGSLSLSFISTSGHKDHWSSFSSCAKNLLVLTASLQHVCFISVKISSRSLSKFKFLVSLLSMSCRSFVIVIFGRPLSLSKALLYSHRILHSFCCVS